ncbi:hypothetical protein [Oricola indica]|uniref:hypothetical protein n=1 Tax=Oricola indica TaxID=2872591 RepID=UPI001CBF1794|nr:hypothetical protein [Oricola indica]
MEQLAEFVRPWIQRFWWVRGIVAALCVITLASKIFDLPSNEVLAVIHAAIYSWEKATAWIAGILPNFFPFNLVGPVEARAILFAVSLAPVGIAGNLYYWWWLPEKIEKSPHIAYYAGKYSGAEFLYNKFGPKITYYFGRSLEIIGVTISVVSGFFLYYYIVLLYYRDNKIAYGLLVAGVLYIAIAFILIQPIRRGFILVLSFLLTVEVLYIARTPGVTDAIRAFACEFHGGAHAICAPPEM